MFVRYMYKVKFLSIGYNKMARLHCLVLMSILCEFNEIPFTEAANYNFGPYLFDKDAHGPKANILDGGRLARRYEGYCWAVCLGDRPLKINETLHFNITEIESGWGAGSLNVGISYKSPDDYRPGDLVICDENVTEELPETEVFIFQRFYSPENVYSFRVDGMGVAYLSPNVTSDDVIFTNVDVNKTIWVIFNLFGDAKAVELLGVTKDP